MSELYRKISPSPLYFAEHATLAFIVVANLSGSHTRTKGKHTFHSCRSRCLTYIPLGCFHEDESVFDRGVVSVCGRSKSDIVTY